MIKIKLNGKDLSINEGNRVVDLLEEENKTNYMVCQINEQVKELSYELSKKNDNAVITCLDLTHIEAGKAYEATLRYLICMAFHNLYPNLTIRFSYNVSRSVFCQVIGSTIHISKVTNDIKTEVARLVKQNLPINRITCSVQEAQDIYERMGHIDKKAILTYRPEQIVHLYKCGDYYDYMYNYMLPSTGCIKEYIIRPYSPGIIIQYPRYELKGIIPPFVEESTYGKTLKKAYRWGIDTSTQTIVDVNKKVETEPRDFVQMCEAKHNRMLAELGNLIQSDIENIRLIAIAGPSSSGKTTFCNRLRIELMSRGINPVMISMDDYYLTRDEIARIQGCELDDVDLEHVNTLDIDLFNQNLFDLINGDEVTLPKFNFTTGKRETGATIKIDINSPIIIEGIHALNEKLTSSIPKHQKFKIYIAPQVQMNIDNHSPLNITDIRLIRRIVRDMQFRNCPAAGTIDMWQSVRKGEFKWIYPNQEGANYVYNSELSYELSVFRTIALPALREIKPTDPQYIVANRLIKYLKYFKPIDDFSIIPCNSLIREFIGGSCYNV